MKAQPVSQKNAVAIILALQGLAILGTWIGFIRAGAFKNGIRTVENNMYLGIHVLAEAIMGLLLVIGAVAMLLQKSWGRAVAIAGAGAVIYSTVNSMADTIRNKPNLTPVLLANLLIAAGAVFSLARRDRN
jgi:hypothetical protein